MDNLMIFLRILHIFFAVFWGGTVFYMALFVLPASKAIPEGGKFMMQLGKTNGMPIVLMLSPTFTVIGGIWLMYRDSAGFGHAWMSSAMGQTFSIGGAAAILAYLVGLTINMPAGMKMGKLGNQMTGPPSPEIMQQMTSLRNRLVMGTNIIAVLLIVATVCMAIARYMV